jgi:hypothetical protein
VFEFETRHAMKVEHLVQKHLAAERRKEDVSRYEGPGRCNVHTEHIEWFEVDDERAVAVVQGWVRFMDLEPFEENADDMVWELKLKWWAKLANFGMNHDEGDKWLRWLERCTEAYEEEEVIGGEDEERTQPYILPTTPGLLHPNLATQLFLHTLQLITFLVIVGSTSFQQLASLMVLGFTTLVIRQSYETAKCEIGNDYTGVLGGVWYPDLTERLLATDDMGMAES